MDDEIPHLDSDALLAPNQAPRQPADQSRTNNTSGSRPLSWGNYLARSALILVTVVGLFFSVIPTGRSALRTITLLPGVVAGRQLAPIVASGDPIRHVSLTISSQDGPVFLDVWEPTPAPPPIPGARQGILIIAGVGDNRENPQLINLTESLARVGLVVMTMTTNTLINYVLSPTEADATVQAFETLLHWPGVGSTRVGILGLSAGNAPASLAAADPRIQRQVAFLTFFGGLFNARNLIADIGRRALIVDGQLEAWQPDRVPLSVLANTMANTLSPGEASKFKAAFDLDHPTPLTTDEVAQLSPSAAAAYHILVGDQPNQIQRNIDALSPEMLRLLEQVSPSSVVSRISAPIYLLHDRNDSFVPFTESINYAAALARLQHPHEFVQFSIFQHTEVSDSIDFRSLLRDAPRLFLMINTVMLRST
jgi:hypothetical protein